jgi:hypothetical protein
LKINLFLGDGLMPSRAFVAGFFTTSFEQAGNVNRRGHGGPLNNAIERLEDCGDLLTGQFGIAADSEPRL